MNKRLKTFLRILPVVYLLLSVIAVQGLQAHTHIYDHEPDGVEDIHTTQMHFSHTDSEKDHSELSNTIDLSVPTIIKVPAPMPMVALLFSIITIIFLPFSNNTPAQYWQTSFFYYKRSVFSLPSLRAPPR